MPRLRFETARDLFEAFPSAVDELGVEPADEPSLPFLKSLADSNVDQAVGFCAYLLPRREAVWWGCQSIRALPAPRTHEEEQALAAAEQWVREPEEELRIAALNVGRESDYKRPATWLALAAGWAGPTIPFEDKVGQVPPEQTARAVRAGVLIAASRIDLTKRTELLRKCVDEGIRLAAGDAG